MRITPPRTRDLADESGLSLVEILVAITLIAIVATSSATLCLTAMAAAATQERRQVAVAILSGTMETVSAQTVDTNPATTVSGLYAGRAQSLALSAWASNSTTPGVAQTYPGWDPTATVASTPALPFTAATSQAGSDYTVQTLIGPCYRPTSGGDCGVLPSLSNAPALTPTGYVKLIRAIVVVKWTAGASCTPTDCSYSATTILDPSIDLRWITHT